MLENILGSPFSNPKLETFKFWDRVLEAKAQRPRSQPSLNGGGMGSERRERQRG